MPRQATPVVERRVLATISAAVPFRQAGDEFWKRTRAGAWRAVQFRQARAYHFSHIVYDIHVTAGEALSTRWKLSVSGIYYRHASRRPSAPSTERVHTLIDFSHHGKTRDTIAMTCVTR